MPKSAVHYRIIDRCEPIAVAHALAGQPHLAFLDSGKNPSGLGRYSYVASNPFGVFKTINQRAYWNDTPLSAAPFEALRDLLERYQLPTHPDLPPFQTGAIGYLSYEAARLIETVPGMVAPDDGMPDIQLGFYDVIFVHDHAENQSMILSSGRPETEPDQRAKRAERRISELLALLDAPAPVLPSNPPITEWRFDVTRESFEASVAGTIERILSGDLFQANLAQQFIAQVPDAYAPLAFYTTLRGMSPATFGAYLGFGDIQITSNSPERFLTLKDRRIEARPIKGTAARGATPETDAALAQTLVNSVKDRAENTMIVDLLRNDLSRVSEPFSVKVPILCGLETYASVHHLVSVVEAQLAEGCDGVDLIKAAFPCGSITGAPKIKAMEIIGEVERLPRGIYCGSIGYFGFDGTVDLNVAIRTVTFSDQTARFHAGGGITALSNPRDEYDETLIKAERIFQACRKPDGDEASA